MKKEFYSTPIKSKLRVIKVFNDNLLKEYLEVDYNFNASRIYRKCIRKGKLKIAEKIKLKYKLEDINDDRITAMGLALLYSKQDRLWTEKQN